MQTSLRSSLGRLVITFALVGTGFVGCKDDNKDDSASVSRYNELVAEHNALVERSNSTVTGAWEASNKFVDYVRASDSMNEALKVFSDNVLLYIDFSDQGKMDQFESMREQFETGNARIMAAQVLLIEQFNELYDVAPALYRNDEAYLDRLNIQSRNSDLLHGVSNQHQVLWEIVTRHYNEAGGQAENRIVLNQQEAVVATVETGGGITISNGQAITYSNAEFRRQAQAAGFETSVIDDSQTMASTMNGVVGMACADDNLIEVLNNLVAHMKNRANQNTDDLEIVLAIDYSGSMSNNIRTVMNELSSFVSSLSNVTNAGRNVRIGISTFGEPHKEKIDLDLTTNINQVQTKLAELLNRFDRDNHSVNPGEASYYGLAKTSEMSWASQNRQTIVITDEPSYSLQIRDQNYIDSVQNRMANIGVYPLMVRICN